MKLKLKPSSRMKHRYFLIEAESKGAIEQAILDAVGVLGWAKAAPLFVEHHGKQHILAVSRESLNEIRAAFELFSQTIRIIRVSGTLKGLQK